MPPMPQYQQAPVNPLQGPPHPQAPPPQPRPQGHSQPAAQTQAQPATHSPLPIRENTRQPSDFVDPAILSYGRSPAQSRTASKPPPPQEQAPSTPIKSMLAKAAESLPNNSSPFIGDAGKSTPSQKVPKMKDLSTAQTPKSREASVAQAPNGDADGQQDYSSKKKVRRGQKKKAQDPPPIMNAEVSRNGNDMNGSVKKGKGWRQTPLLQPSPQTSSPQGSSEKKLTKKQREEAKEVQRNGWATEDATDVQDDFDFEANLKLFDKKTVFDQLRQGDTTADEDRLVGHNKIQRNLRPNENVLSPSAGAKGSPNELDSTSDADTELNFPNGRSSSRHSATRASMKRPSRQNSGQVPDRPHPLTASMSSDRGISMSRSVTSQGGKAGPKKVSSISTASPRPDRGRSPQSAISTKTHVPSGLASQQPPAEPHLAIHPTLTPCPTLVPAGLDVLEKATTASYGITPDAITENAARCIAETAMHMFDSTTSGGSRRGSRANTLTAVTMSMSSSMTLDRNSTPVIVVIAGNHATGARAIAAARHLVCRNVKVIVAEAAYESAEMLDPQVKAQVAILKRMVKGGANIRRGSWRRASEYIKKLAGPPAVIIDALLGGNMYESLVDSTPNTTHSATAQLETREMIDWANRSRAPVLSIVCPSGVSGTDGEVKYVEGEPLSIRPERVLALGVPVQGLLEGMKGGEKWDMRLADIGLNIALSVEDAVGFGPGWVVEVGLVDGSGEAVDG